LALTLYLDDCADSRLLAVLLAQVGHAVVRPVDAGTVGVADAVHLAYAVANGLIVITKDPGDFHALHEQDQNHPGIFGVYQDNDPGRDMKPADIVAAIGRIEAAVTHGYSIAGQFHALNDWR
jgi:predicted nuclease of predicted toxin-antitoxin system